MYYNDLKSIMVFGGYNYQRKQLEISRNIYSLSVSSEQEGQWRMWMDHRMPSIFPFNWAFVSRSQSIVIGWDSRRNFTSLSNVSAVVYRLSCTHSFPLAGKVLDVKC